MARRALSPAPAQRSEISAFARDNEVVPSSLSTQQALGHALKQALLETPLNRVTVRQLTEAAGVTRQTFYYHFTDVYDLTVWLFEEEIAHRILSHAT